MKFRDKASFFTWLGRRFWEGRQFYSSYIALFISITNWITIQYELFLGRLPFLDPAVLNIWVFGILAVAIFSVLGILGGHYIHRKRQFRLEQSIAIEENPYLYRAAPGKERELMIPIAILQVEALEVILKINNSLTEEKKKQLESYKQILSRLARGEPLGTF
jgi:hypothetical protein